MEPGTTYVQKLPSGKVGFVRRPIKIKPVKSILADAFVPNRDAPAGMPPYTCNLDPPPIDPIDPKDTNQPISPMDGLSQTYHHPHGRECQLAARKYDPVASNLGHRDAAAAIPAAPSPIIEPHSLTYSRVPAVPTTETRHRCAVCGRYRSPSYQYRHPILPGQIPHTSVCRKCRFNYTSSGDSTESDDTDRRSRGRKRNRGRRNSSRQRFNREPSIQPSPPPQIPQVSSPQTTQPQKSPTPPPPLPPTVTRIESSPNIFHFCPNPPDLCTFRSQRNSHDYGLTSPASSPRCCTARSCHYVPNYKETDSSCCLHSRHHHCRHREPRHYILRKSRSFDEPRVVPSESPRRSVVCEDRSPLRQVERFDAQDIDPWSRPSGEDWVSNQERARRPRSPTRSPSPVRERRRVESYQYSPSRDRQPSQAKVCRFAPEETRSLSNVQYQTWDGDRSGRKYSRAMPRDDEEDNGRYNAQEYQRPASTHPSRDANIQRQSSRVIMGRSSSDTIFIPKARRQFGVRYGLSQPSQQWGYESEEREREPESRYREYRPSSPRRVTATRPSYSYPIVRDEQEEQDAVQGYSNLRNERQNNRHYHNHEIIEGPRGIYNPPGSRNPSGGHRVSARERSVVW